MASSAAQSDTSAEYWPIQIARSDGQGYQNLDHSPLAPNEDQDVTQLERWEVIVAGHLQNQIGPKDDSVFEPQEYHVLCADQTLTHPRAAIQTRRLSQGLRAPMRRAEGRR